MFIKGLIRTLWWLLCVHVLTDFVWQPEWMSKHKNPDPLEHLDLDAKYGSWWHTMLAHSLLNGAGVAYVTGNLWLGVAETILHFITDFSKCIGLLTAGQDQNIHIASKLIWALCYALLYR